MTRTYSDPISYQSGDLITADILDTYLSANTLFLGDPPYAKVRQVAGQSIDDSTTTVISFDTETTDNDAIFDAGSPTLLTCQNAGVYDFSGRVSFGSTAKYVFAGIYVGGTLIAGMSEREIASASPMGYAISGTYKLSVAENVTLRAYQESGGALDVFALLSMRWVSTGT